MQIIDLDYIVSIGPVHSYYYDGFSFGESHVDFTVYLKLGTPIVLRVPTGNMRRVPEDLIGWVNKERLKLIEAWKTKPREKI